MALSMLAEHHSPPYYPVQFPPIQLGDPHPYGLPSPATLIGHVPSKQSLNRDHFLAQVGPIAIPKRRPHTRSLTASMAVATMIIPEDTVPSSPPELTDSRSSKSSSYNSSILSDSTAEDNNHFEDIALEDVYEPTQLEVYHTRRLSRSSKRSPSPKNMAQVSQQPSRSGRGPPNVTGGSRDLTSTSRPKYPSLRGQVNGAVQDQSSLNLPSRKQMRRGFTSPSSPSLPTMLSSGTRSRSPSPTPTSQLHPSPRALPPRRINTHSPGQRFAPRRQSWQPSRKSVKELEAEYHDSDEEVPEDAVIHNVPLSPRVNQRSATPSPERPNPFTPASRSDLQQKGRQPSASDGPGSREPSPHSAAEPSTSRSLPLAITESTTPTFPPPRSKSWNIVMSDLSKEAQELSIALESHAEELSLSRRPSNVPSENQEDRNELSLHRAKTASTVELPPVRKGNIMIDPLPISKEKEAVLTRTRPSWLPPKSQKEEKKHLKEYQRMMAQSADLDRRKAAKLEAAQQLMVEQRGTMEKIWETHVLPNWSQSIRDKKTRELWWKGVATKSRGEVWQRAIGNELGLNESSYEKALARANVLEKEFNAAGGEEATRKKEHEWFKAIKRDAANAFPELRIFQQRGPLHDDLVKVLMAYAMYRNDVGYVYGTHLPAALLLLTLPSPATVFISLANLLNRPLALAHLLPDPGALARAHSLVLSTLSYKLPRLYQHLTNPQLDLHPEEWIDPILRSLFCARLGVDHASRLWDVYVFEGDSVLIRAVVGCLIRLEGRLYTTRSEILKVLGWPNPNVAADDQMPSSRLWDVGDEEDFMRAVREAGKVEADGSRSPLPA